MLGVLMLSVLMLSVLILSVVMLNLVAPKFPLLAIALFHLISFLIKIYRPSLLMQLINLTAF
jgi:hypothetical protein